MVRQVTVIGVALSNPIKPNTPMRMISTMLSKQTRIDSAKTA